MNMGGVEATESKEQYMSFAMAAIQRYELDCTDLRKSWTPELLL
jgi:hypothetical protein